MRAKLIYEKFAEDSDPIEDMGIGPLYIIRDSLALSIHTEDIKNLIYVLAIEEDYIEFNLNDPQATKLFSRSNKKDNYPKFQKYFTDILKKLNIIDFFTKWVDVEIDEEDTGEYNFIVKFYFENKYYGIAPPGYYIKNYARVDKKWDRNKWNGEIRIRGG